MNLETRRELVRLRQKALCEALCLDPGTVTQINVDFQGGRTVVAWAGRRVLSEAETAAALDAVAKVLVVPDE